MNNEKNYTFFECIFPNKCADGKTSLKQIKMLLLISLCWKEKSPRINKRAALLLGTPEYMDLQEYKFRSVYIRMNRLKNKLENP